MTDEKTIEQFADADEFDRWLSANHADHPGIWMKIAKKGSPVPTVSYQSALDVALTFGWIDGQKKPFDTEFFLQAFTQRRARSVWSKRNVEKVAAMIAAGTMHPAGLAQVDAAKADGRWDRAYAGSSAAAPAPDFLAALETNAAAKEFYATINAANRFAIYYRIQNAKREETRARLIATFVEMLARGETLH
ncbi:MAG TPA: YdeI/OmpD-associated family protein [Galbitalea sp.]